MDQKFETAAALTFAMLRFEQEGAHEYRAHERPDQGHFGRDRFIFLPSWKALPRDSVIPFLASLPCPALIYPVTTRGMAALLLLDELQDERKWWGRKTLDNQLAGINDMAAQMNLDADSKILLEVTDETLVISLDELRGWSQRFGAPVGWSMGRHTEDDRASAKIDLIASDGRGLPPAALRNR